MLDLSHPIASTDRMPDTKGINFYTADPDLSFLLRQHLSENDDERGHVLLTVMGQVASRKMDELAGVANRQGPVLVQYDKYGRRIDEVVFHPAYHELERIAYEDFAIAACSHREDALGWPGRVPQPVKFALDLCLVADQRIRQHRVFNLRVLV